jgi:hypothetical protein
VAPETDCSNLQTWFDGASSMHSSVSGDLSAMGWYTDLMKRIDSRMNAADATGEEERQGSSTRSLIRSLAETAGWARTNS